MKAKIAMLFGLIGILIMTGGCASAQAGDKIKIDATTDDFNKNAQITKQIEISEGSTLIITLDSNPSTGFEWSETAVIGNQTILEQTGHEFINPESNIPGAPGKETWTFKALKKGVTNIAMEYSRPWQGGEKGVWKFNVTVTVK